MKRKIIKIHEDKCNGCGICIEACHEGALELVNGKAKLVSDIYCDGLGDCLPTCPTGAIEMIEREAQEFNEEAVKKKMNINKSIPCGCPSQVAKSIDRNNNVAESSTKKEHNLPSELMQWPVQMRLINPSAEYLRNADLLFAADCTAFAYGNFHEDFIKGKITIIACPKLDDNNYNIEKIIEILRHNDINSITVVKMQVPCCTGLSQAVKKAMLETETIVKYNEITISTDGKIIN